MRRVLKSIAVVCVLVGGLGAGSVLAGDRDKYCDKCHSQTVTVTETMPGETVTVIETEPGETTTVTEPGQTVTVTTPGPERVRTVTQTETVTVPNDVIQTVTLPAVTEPAVTVVETQVRTRTVMKVKWRTKVKWKTRTVFKLKKVCPRKCARGLHYRDGKCVPMGSG